MSDIQITTVAATEPVERLMQEYLAGKISYEMLETRIQAMGYKTTSLFENVIAREHARAANMTNQPAAASKPVTNWRLYDELKRECRDYEVHKWLGIEVFPCQWPHCNCQRKEKSDTNQPAAREREEIARLVRSILSLLLRDPSISTLQFADAILAAEFHRSAPEGVAEKENRMELATKIPMNDCGLTINTGRDGTWLHFKAKSGKHASINVENWADSKDGGVLPFNITAQALRDWAADRQEQRNAPAIAPTPPRTYAEVAREWCISRRMLMSDSGVESLAALLADVAAKAIQLENPNDA